MLGLLATAAPTLSGCLVCLLRRAIRAALPAVPAGLAHLRARVVDSRRTGFGPASRAGVTQLAECLLPKRNVAGSNLLASSGSRMDQRPPPMSSHESTNGTFRSVGSV